MSATIHVNASNTIVVAGNSSISNIAVDNEILTGAAITQVFWGVDGNGHINVKRNGYTVAIYDSTGFYDYAGTGMSLTVNQASNIAVTFVGTANAYLFFEVQKIGDFTSEYFQN
jgi:hypothetical protein